MLQKYYFINKLDTKNIDQQSVNTAIIYRNYELKDNIETIIKIKEYCKKKRYKFFLSNNTKLSIKLNLDVVYIPSFNKVIVIFHSQKRKIFSIIGSAHNNNEIKIKEKQGVNIIFLSSLFKKNKIT